MSPAKKNSVTSDMAKQRKHSQIEKIVITSKGHDLILATPQIKKEDEMKNFQQPQVKFEDSQPVSSCTEHLHKAASHSAMVEAFYDNSINVKFHQTLNPKKTKLQVQTIHTTGLSNRATNARYSDNIESPLINDTTSGRLYEDL